VTKLEIPAFSSEAEEAQWWFDHREELDDEFLAAGSEGRLSQGSLAQHLGLAPNFVRIDPDDAHLARELASRRGLEFEPFIQSLIHEALMEREHISDSHTPATASAV
jgi:hypothetical protein